MSEEKWELVPSTKVESRDFDELSVVTLKKPLYCKKRKKMELNTP